MAERPEGRPRFLDRLLDPAAFVRTIDSRVVEPTLQVALKEESRISSTVAVLVAIFLEATLPYRIANHPRYLIPALALLLLIATLGVMPRRFDHSRLFRGLMLLVILVMTIGNIASGARLIVDLVNGTGIRDAGELLWVGGSIWLTNVIVFALWYWEFDGGGPMARLKSGNPYPAFLFPQHQTPERVRPGWRPEFLDYFYVSFTNAAAFSPTDTMPMTRWAKMAMFVQSAFSLSIAILVIARAVNVLQ
ncbi:MAG: hypothetical protein U0W40_06630 [Acidimicrobiia bacterium]